MHYWNKIPIYELKLIIQECSQQTLENKIDISKRMRDDEEQQGEREKKKTRNKCMMRVEWKLELNAEWIGRFKVSVCDLSRWLFEWVQSNHLACRQHTFA